MDRFKFSKPAYNFLRALHRTASRHFSSHKTHLENASSMASLLKTRAVIRFRGPDTVKFLQGLVTNDVRKLVNLEPATVPTPNLPSVSTPPIYAAMLTPQGRFLYDLFIYRPALPDEKFDESGCGPGPNPDEPVLYADVDSSVLDELLETMKRYRLRSKVDIENVTEDFSCWQRYGMDLTNKASLKEEPEAVSVGYVGAADQSGVSTSRGNRHGWHWDKDPRLDCLGFRGIFPSNSPPPLVESVKETDETNYLLWRIERGVAEGSSEIPKGEAMPLEYNLAGLNAISFDKGCYVGQELVARTHHRGVIRKRLLPLKFVDDNGKEVERKVSPGSEVTGSTSGKKAGIVTTTFGCCGLGLLRLEEAFKGLGNLAIRGQEDIKVQAFRPEWWPSEWSVEHQQQNAAA